MRNSRCFHNIIMFSQAEDLWWGITYDNTMREFIVQTYAGQKLIFSKCNDLYVDMTSQVHRNFPTRVNDGVKLFLGNHKSTEKWKLEGRPSSVNQHYQTLIAASRDVTTGSGNGSVRIMNLNTGKVCTRTPSQIT